MLLTHQVLEASVTSMVLPVIVLATVAASVVRTYGANVGGYIVRHRGNLVVLAAWVALGTALILSANMAQASEVRTSDQIGITVPQSVSASINATGSVSLPQTTMSNTGTVPVTVTKVGTSMGSGVSGTWTLKVQGVQWYSGLNNTANPSKDLNVGQSVNLDWATTFSGTQAGSMVGQTLGTLDYGVTAKQKQAFAVWTDGDKTLRFFKRYDVPTVGSSIDGHKVDKVYTGVEDVSGSSVPWSGIRSDALTVSFVDSGVQPTSTNAWFYKMSKVTRILGLEKLDTSHVTVMASMFSEMSSLPTLDVSTFDVSKVTDFANMFSYMSSLTSLNISGWQTSSATSFYETFRGCSKITTFDVSKLNFSKVYTMFGTFRGMTSLTSLNVGGIDVSHVVDMYWVFGECSKLANIQGLSTWNTQKAMEMGSMFRDMDALTSIDVSTLNTANVTDMGYMFQGCDNLKSLDLSSWNMSKASVIPFMMRDCPKLEKIVLPSTFSFISGGNHEWWLTDPSLSSISGADGKWYDSNGNGYSSPFVFPNGAGTYYASPSLVPAHTYAVANYTEGPGAALTFYHRGGALPTSGKVYTGFDTVTYSSADEVPWLKDYPGIFIYSVTFADSGIKPVSMAYWFAGTSGLGTVIGLNKINTSACKSMTAMFQNSHVVKNNANLGDTVDGKSVLDLTSWSWSAISDMDNAFLPRADILRVGEFFKLSGISHYQWISGDYYSSDGMPYGSPYNDLPSGKGEYYNGVDNIPVTFAIYTSSDKYLRFYNRYGQAPSEGSTFDGHHVDNVYTNFAYLHVESAYDIPWSDVMGSIRYVDFVDTISPLFLSYWFNGARDLVTLYHCDNLDTSNVTDMALMFYAAGYNWMNAHTYTFSIDVSSWDVSKVTTMTAMFCYSGITSLDISNWDMRSVTDMSGFLRLTHVVSLSVGYNCDFSSAGSSWLPTPESSWIYQGDGNWYSSKGVAYASPYNFPSYTRDTYYASTMMLPKTSGLSVTPLLSATTMPLPGRELSDAATTGPLAAWLQRAA